MIFTTNFGKRTGFSNINNINPDINENKTTQNTTLVNEPNKSNIKIESQILRDKHSMLVRSINLGMLYNIDKIGCSSCKGAK